MYVYDLYIISWLMYTYIYSELVPLYVSVCICRFSEETNTQALFTTDQRSKAGAGEKNRTD